MEVAVVSKLLHFEGSTEERNESTDFLEGIQFSKNAVEVIDKDIVAAVTQQLLSTNRWMQISVFS